jgi:hypothetical protein
LDELRAAHARARERFWELHGAPERVTIDVDATLICAHSEKERAAGNYKGGYGFFPLQAYVDETHEALAGLLRAGNAGANTASGHEAVIDLALAQIPPVTSRASRSWSGRTPPAPHMACSTTAKRRTCASRSATS